MKNRLRKIIPYLFVLIMLVGFLGVTNKAQAEEKCWRGSSSYPLSLIGTKEACLKDAGNTWGEKGTTTTQTSNSNNGGVNTTGVTPPQEDALEKAIARLDCGVIGNASITKCIVKGSYLVFFQLPSFILTVSGNFFNAFAGLTLSSKLYTSNNFIPEAWAVVRDISNIFFIIILLYTAIQTILGLSHDAKKTIAQVIIMAFLINFSMFFTRIIIDSSNVLALIFYNKIAVKGPDNATIPYKPNTLNTGVVEKDMGGALVSGFNPARLMDAKILEEHTVMVDGVEKKIPRPEDSFFLALIFVSGAIFLFASYAFFVAGFSLLGRLVELWMLIIFSPFAFMTSALPLGEIMEDMNWKKWMHRLMSTAFMAPVFMFFMYLIARIVSADMFSQFLTNNTDTGIKSATSKILAVAIPATIIILLLLKATSYAKKGGGQLGSMAMGLGKMVGGLALGAATGGAALAATGTLGKLGSSLAGREDLKEAANKKGMGGWAAKMALKASNYGANASFDVRKSPLGGLAAKAGLNLEKGTGILGLAGKDTEGGYKGTVKRTQEKQEKEKELFKTTKTDDEVREMTGGKYQSANELNAARMEAYKNNLGKNGFMYSAAYSTAKRTAKAGSSEEDIEKLAGKIKLAFGAIGAVVGGGVIGYGNIASALSAAGSVVGAAGSVGAAATSAMGLGSTVGTIVGGGAALAAGAGVMGGLGQGGIGQTIDAQKGAEKSIGKEAAKLKSAGERVRLLKEQTTNLEKLINDTEKDAKDAGKKYSDYVKDRLEAIETIISQQNDQEDDIKGTLSALKAERAKSVAAGQPVNANLESEISRFQTEMTTLRNARITNLKEKEKFTTAQAAPERLSRLKKQADDITKSVESHPAAHKDGKIAQPTPGGGGGGHEEKHEEHGSSDNHGGHAKAA